MSTHICKFSHFPLCQPHNRIYSHLILPLEYTHSFLTECQKKLGHKLPLAAYLLKPVQRITKYQLLLKDLLKFSDTGTCTKELQKALDCMLVVLKCVNDSMHQIAITGFPVRPTNPSINFTPTLILIIINFRLIYHNKGNYYCKTPSKLFRRIRIHDYG